jgi:hypothetical protein
MLPNLPKPQVSLFPKVRWLNRVTQVRQFFLSQSIQISLNLYNLTKLSQHINTCLIKYSMPKVSLWQVGYRSKQTLRLALDTYEIYCMNNLHCNLYPQ